MFDGSKRKGGWMVASDGRPDEAAVVESELGIAGVAMAYLGSASSYIRATSREMADRLLMLSNSVYEAKTLGALRKAFDAAAAVLEELYEMSKRSETPPTAIAMTITQVKVASKHLPGGPRFIPYHFDRAVAAAVLRLRAVYRSVVAVPAANGLAVELGRIIERLTIERDATGLSLIYANLAVYAGRVETEDAVKSASVEGKTVPACLAEIVAALPVIEASDE